MRAWKQMSLMEGCKMFKICGKTRSFGTVLLFLLFLVLSGCQSFENYYENDKAECKADWDSYREKLDPKPADAVGLIRRFALDNIEALSDKEIDCIQKNEPQISFDEDKMEYSFTWKFNERELIEVVTGMPPCVPLAAYRTHRVYFP